MLVIMRGPSGSGKSWIVEQLCRYHPFVVCSTDNYFMVDGEYKFDPTKLGEYHKKNQENVLSNLLIKQDVIVDNTNITYKELSIYLAFAKTFGTPFFFLNAFTPSIRGNPKGVPDDVVNRHIERWEPDWVILLKTMGYNPEWPIGD